MSYINFCSVNYTKKQVIQEVKKILLIPNLHTEIRKYNKLSQNGKNNYFKKIKKQAYKKWHSDVRTTTNPKAELYSKCVFEALDIFKIIAGNPEYFTEPINENINISKEETNTQNISISEMQEKLRNAIDKILSQAKKTKEKVLLDKETLYRDIIIEEQENKIWEAPICAMFLYGIILLIFIKNNPTPEFKILFTEYFLIFLLSICFLGLIPFSRYWLFSKIPYGESIVFPILFIGTLILEKIWGLLDTATKNASEAKDGLILLLCLLPFCIIAFLFNIFLFLFGLLMLSFYQIALSIVGDKRFKSITKEQIFYDGVADWYIYEILSKAENKLTDQEKQIIKFFFIYYS